MDKIQVSACGYLCTMCRLKETKDCSGCSVDSKIDCKIIKCAVKNKLKTCLQCGSRLRCRLYGEGIRYCPLRMEMFEKQEWKEYC
ncbi:MAG: hypothetical protein WC974_06185 [Thermoplasmata archaeon]